MLELISDGVRLLNCDCFDLLEMTEDNSVDLVLIDPPYSDKTHEGFRSTKDTGAGNKHATSTIDFPPVDDAWIQRAFGEAGRVARRWVISFLDWRHMHVLEENPPGGLEFVRFGVWVKPNAMHQLTADRPATGWEALAFLHRADEKKRWHGGGRHSVFTNYTVRAEYFASGATVGGARSYPNHHPNEKPVPLLAELIKLFTDPGDLVMDFVAGSGSTAVAAVRTGRRFIGSEWSQVYFEEASARIKDCLDQGVLPMFEER